MHGNPEYEKNSMFKATGAPVGFYDFPRSIRDSDSDGVPGPIDCIQTKGISIKQEWIGDVVHLKDTVTQTFQILFASGIQPPAQDSLEAWINHLKDGDVPGSGKLIDVGGWHNELNLYGIKIPNCRIINVEAPTSENRMNDAVGRGQLNITIEQKRCGDFSNLDSYERTVDVDGTPTTVNDYLGLKELFQGTNASSEEDDICPYLEDLTEDFKFNYGKGNQVEIEHSVGIKLFDSCPKGVTRDHVNPDAPGTPGQFVPGTDDDQDGTDENFCRTSSQYNVDKALILARKILDLNIPHFGIAFQGGVLKELDTEDIITYYTESQNLLTGDVSMSKKMTLLKHSKCCPDWETYGYSSEQECIDADGGAPNYVSLQRCGWSADYNHTVVMDTRGIVTVTEKGKVKGMKKIPTNAADAKKVSDAAYDRALAGLESLIGNNWANAAARCVSTYDEHKDFFIHTDPATLAVGGVLREFDGANQPTMPALNITHPTDKSKGFNNLGRDCSYSITFSTDPNYYQDYSATRTLSAQKDRTGAIAITEKVSLKQHEPKGSGGNPISTIYPQDFAGHGAIPGSKARIDAFYGDLSDDFQAPDYGCKEADGTTPKTLKLKSRNISFDPNGRSLSYTTNYVTDKTVSCNYPDEHGIRKLDISIDDKIPRRMKQEYPIVNWKILVHDSFQTGLGERAVTMRGELDREPKVNKLTDPKLPKKSLDRLAELAKEKLLEVFADNDLDGLVADDMYLKLCSYTFDSRGKITLKVTANYLQAMEI